MRIEVGPAVLAVLAVLGAGGCKSGADNSWVAVPAATASTEAYTNAKCEEWRSVYARRVLPAIDSILSVAITDRPKSYSAAWQRSISSLEAAFAEERIVADRMPVRTRAKMATVAHHRADLLKTVRTAIGMTDADAAYKRIIEAELAAGDAVNALLDVCLDDPA